MRSRSAYTRRLRANARLQKRLAATLLISVAVGGIASLAIYPERDVPRHPFSFDASESALMQANRHVAGSMNNLSSTPPVRKVYPFSVVPGGVYDRGEVAHIVATDSLVASHYSDIDLTKIRSVEVVRPRGVYVSYRKGDKIFWTSKKLMLAPGELVLTDGSNEIRARCGNRISEVPQGPVDAGEPDGIVFDTSYEPIAAGSDNEVLMSAAYEGDFGFMRTPNGHANALESFAFSDGLIRASIASMPVHSSFVAWPPVLDPDRFGPWVIISPGITPTSAPGGGLSVSPKPSSPAPSASGGTPAAPRDGLPLDPMRPGARPADQIGSPSTTPEKPAATPSSMSPDLYSPPQIPSSPHDSLGASQPTPAEVHPVPEPGGLWLSVIGLAAMAAAHIRRRRL